MAETANIAEISKRVSDDLFKTFLWNTIGPRDESWPCEDPLRHKKATPNASESSSTSTKGLEAIAVGDREAKGADESGQKAATHPTDVVFYYDEPYSRTRTYINTDLKSYAAKSITKRSVKDAVESIARALSCAEKSAVWRDRYIHGTVSANIAGLLFVYNHDGDYGSQFDENLAAIKTSNLPIPRNSKLFVLGPHDIQWIDNVHFDILTLRGSKIIGDADNCRFYYPNLVLAKNVQPSAKAATLEMLLGPWMILKHRKDSTSTEDVVVYYRGKGERVQEFSDLIDYLMHYQIVDDGVGIVIRTLVPHKESSAHFQKAIDEYTVRYRGGPEIADRLKAIKYESISQVHRSFSSTEIGMSRG